MRWPSGFVLARARQKNNKRSFRVLLYERDVTISTRIFVPNFKEDVLICLRIFVHTKTLYIYIYSSNSPVLFADVGRRFSTASTPLLRASYREHPQENRCWNMKVKDVYEACLIITNLPMCIFFSNDSRCIIGLYYVYVCLFTHVTVQADNKSYYNMLNGYNV